MKNKKRLRLFFWIAIGGGILWTIVSLQVNQITKVTIHRSKTTGEIVKITDQHGEVVEISHRSALRDFQSVQVWDEP